MALDYSVFKNQNLELLFKASFNECDENGNLIDFGTKYKITLTSNHIIIGKENIPLHKIISLEAIESTCSFVYYDRFNIKKTLHFIYRAMLKSNIQQKTEEFVQKTHNAIATFMRTSAGQEKIIPAPPDTCHICGCAGGVSVEFKKVISLVKFTFFRFEVAVYCKKHIQKRGLYINFVINSLLGWWGLYGIVYTPYYLYLNAKEIGYKSDLSLAISMILTIFCFWPLGLAIYFMTKM